MTFKQSPAPLALRFVFASLLLASAALTGCNAAPSTSSSQSLRSLLGASTYNGEAISTLGANYTFPPDGRHSFRLRPTPAPAPTHPYRHSL